MAAIIWITFALTMLVIIGGSILAVRNCIKLEPELKASGAADKAGDADQEAREKAPTVIKA